MSAVIGITFGNTTSSIAVPTQDGNVDVIANPDGDRSIPTVLSYVGADEYHGSPAKGQLVRNAKNTIVNFRDFIGKKYDDVDVSVSNIGAKAIKTQDGGIGYEISRDNGKTEVVSTHEAAVRHFKQLRSAAQEYIGNVIGGVVITVPVDFTEEQKSELVKIADEADLKVLQLVHEPSAALLTHLTSDDSLLEDKTVVVADIGGIRSDAAVVAVRGGIMTLLATNQKKGLGGDRLDDVLAEYFAKEFEKKYKVDPRKTEKSLAKLRSETITVKKTLSNVQSSTCSIDSLAEGFDFHTSINRLRYELISRQVFAELTEFVEKTVEKAGLDKSEVDEVLLVGGVSHTPKLATNMATIFPEAKVVSPSLVTKAVDPSEATCRGAALQASMIEALDLDGIDHLLHQSVINAPHLSNAIGIKDAEGNFVTVLASETAYPIKKSIEVTNDSASTAQVDIYQGQKTVKETTIQNDVDEDDSEEDEDDEPEIKREVVYKCGELLAHLSLKDLKPNAKLEVTFNINHHGILSVTGRELKQGSVPTKVEISSKA